MSKSIWDEIGDWLDARVAEFDAAVKETIDETAEKTVEPKSKWDEAITPVDALAMLDEYFFDRHYQPVDHQREQALQQAAAEKYSREVEAEIQKRRAAQTPGHKILTEEQVLLIEKVRQLETSFTALVEMSKNAGADRRRTSIAATDAEKAFMMLVKAITA